MPTEAFRCPLCGAAPRYVQPLRNGYVYFQCRPCNREGYVREQAEAAILDVLPDRRVGEKGAVTDGDR